MKYVKAKAVFPQALLAEIQKYVQGELVYIPKLPENYKKWGENTEGKKIIAKRNAEMIRSFQAGASIAELMEQFYLSEETIKKIVYCQST